MPAKTKTIEGWDTGHLQMAFFPLASPRDVQQDWFRDLTGQAPKESLSRPHETVTVGSFEKMTLNLNIDLLKIVFTILPNIDPEKVSGIPTLAQSPKDAANTFLGLMNRWLRLNPPAIKRVGFSGRLLQRTPNTKAGIKILRDYLPAVSLDNSGTDLLYRINRPRKSKVGPKGLIINRLSTWTNIKTTTQTRTMTPGEEVKATTPVDSFYCCCEFDVNTSGEFTKALPRSRLKAILGELSIVALEIAAKGDVR